MLSLGREPAGGSETWPRSGIAGRRPLAGDGVSRRPKAVSKPQEQKRSPEGLQFEIIDGCATEAAGTQ